MIFLTKLNGEQILINSLQIESIDLIPEAKVIMMNGRFYIVKERAEEIIPKTIEYTGKIHCYREDR